MVLGGNKKKGAGEMVQQLRTLGDFAEALGLNPSTHIASHNTITPVLGYLMPSLWPPWICHESDAQTYMQKKRTHNIKMR